MNDELRNRIVRIFERIEGGSNEDMMSLIDTAIDDGDITQEEWNQHEMEICAIFDAGWFTCEECSWTLPISEMSPKEHDHWSCRDCIGEEDD